MTLWYLYLLVSAGLAWQGYIEIEPLALGALAAAVHLLGALAGKMRPAAVRVSSILLAVAALALLWRESYFPPASYLLSLAANATLRPTPQYAVKFLGQWLNPWMLAAGALCFAAAVAAVKRWPRALAACAYPLLMLAWGLQAKAETFVGGTEALRAFYEKEGGRVVRFPAKPSGTFDILLIHVCSLSWQDARDAGADLSHFLSRFDYVLTAFNSGSSYSDPAALRLLKSPCGQMPQSKLYRESPAECYLLDRLRAAGYEAFTVMGHSGAYGGFSENLRKYGHAAPPMDMSDLPAAYRMFDGAAVHSDGAALRKFWAARQKSGAARAALYYNTAALHSGTHAPGSLRLPDDAAAYRARLETLQSDLEGFFGEVERSGRNAVVIFVAEHGAALSGTRMQAKAVRDIPLPPIVMVPAAVKLIGKSARRAVDGPVLATRPSGPQALAWLTAEFLERSPFSKSGRPPALLADELPVTEFLSENRLASVMAAGAGYAYSCEWKNGGEWRGLPDFARFRPGAAISGDELARVRRNKRYGDTIPGHELSKASP